MASTLGTLTLDLIARIGGFTGPMDKAAAAARKSGKAIAESADVAALAWEALGQVAAGALAGLSVGAIFTAFIAETKAAEQEQAQLAAVLRSTGEAAGFSRSQLNDMAGALEKATTYSGGDINKAQTALLAFTGVVGDQFPRALQAAADMAARTGVTVQQAAETIGRALDVPSEGLSSLSKQGFRFTEEQKKLAESFESTGDVASAQGIILKSLEESYGGAAAAARDTFGGALDGLRNAVSGLLTGEGSLDSAKAAIEGLTTVLSDPKAKTVLNLTAQAASALAVILVTRLAAGAVATSAAFVVGQVEAVRYQLALARMAGVAPAAAAGIVSVGVAARGASAAMALLGGPAGVVLLAASALAYFALSGNDADESAATLSTKVDLLAQSFEGFTKNQAAAALQEINKDLLDAQLRAIDAESAVSQYQRLLREHPNDSRQREWNESLITAQGELDTARQKVEAFGDQINILNGILSAAPVIEQSKAYRDLAKTLDEQILLAGKKTNADKLSARIGAGLVTGLKEGEGELLVAKAKTLDASEAAATAEKKRAESAKSAAKAVVNAENATRKRGEDAVTDYQRQIALINTSADARKKATEVSKLQFEIESGKLVGINAQQQERLKILAAELDSLQKLKLANEDAAKARAFGATLTDGNQTARMGFEIELSGGGSGDKLKERLKADLAIQQDFNKQLAELQKQYNGGDISEDLYNQETELLREALGQRMEIQQEYYEQQDEAQNNWLDGVASAWENYRDTAMDYQQQAADFTASTLDTLTGTVSDGIASMILESESLGDAFVNVAATMAKSIINALAQMAAQWLVYQAVQLVAGKATQASASVAMVANAQATAFQASLAAFASTAAIPIVGPLLAPGAAAAAATFAAPLVAGVSAASLAGMAHDGLDSVPETGTWLLAKGERVTTAETSAKLDSTLSKIQAGQSRKGAIAPVVNLYEDASKAGTSRANSDGGVDVWVANILSDGPAHDALQQKYGLQTRGS
ncbi:MULTISPECIES: phage tail tape measure protein [unclassified Pseudomonas]|uniref:phage tail tape measure protein n=1 Tax=unclassified Pseudomonas TaxID=196821 RepID=UPI000C88E3D4|nr:MULTISPECIES: phage tail tape measure protein [unclassified Pseudomonas]PMZ68613.1 phage tail tape measure protein [Pseudomonas sp. GW247-3R2A]PMY71923.1 phage tail tape measure protein [Pseudomonas sp. MPR-R3A]PMY98856.1 phage tail tape measure protein [Pseudomonas sp. FW305-124]PNA94164.1 phage tail tape measure protein [Pseudomonas sp. FW300-E2]PNB03077.1 phage tail tape measure protein [Pseudomonas sp. MPR-AND1B]